MNSGVFPGVQLSGEPIEGNKVALEVVTTSGVYVTKGANLEITLIGGGVNGIAQSNGGDSGATVIKRIIGLPAGTTLTVIIGGVGGMSTCLIPGYSQLIANGGAGAGAIAATGQGGDININGQVGTFMDQNGCGGVGGSTLLGLGGGPATTGKSGNGYGSGGGASTAVAGSNGSGQPGVMVVRYF